MIGPGSPNCLSNKWLLQEPAPAPGSLEPSVSASLSLALSRSAFFFSARSRRHGKASGGSRPSAAAQMGTRNHRSSVNGPKCDLEMAGFSCFGANFRLQDSRAAWVSLHFFVLRHKSHCKVWFFLKLEDVLLSLGCPSAKFFVFVLRRPGEEEKTRTAQVQRFRRWDGRSPRPE